jgi:EAL domain-containing protein (putative c-di-GMP-specific phosphodiesterase class I)
VTDLQENISNIVNNEEIDLLKEKDRFLSFALASADLFLEISEDGTITYAYSSEENIHRIKERSFIGQEWLNLFDKSERAKMVSMRSHAKLNERCGPFIVSLSDMIDENESAVITGIQVPDKDVFYLTIAFSNLLSEKINLVLKNMQKNHLLDKDGFLTSSKETLGLAKSMGQDIDMTLIIIEDLEETKERMGDEAWAEFNEEIIEYIRLQSIDGSTAAEIKEGNFSVVHDHSVDSDTLIGHILMQSKQIDPEGRGVNISGRTVTTELESLSDRDVSKALVYTLGEFEREGTALNIDTLSTSFKAYVSANAQKIAQFKSITEQLSFDINFQPIVDIKTRELSHYEILTRFQGGRATEEWINFGEDIGMAAEFDIAVCERAINYLMYQEPDNPAHFAVNLSGQSIENEQFFRTLHTRLQLSEGLNERLMFEITESSNIADLPKVNYFVNTLQKDGYKICMDDFGSGSSSFNYIQNLHVDYVKIDGSYTDKIITSERDAILVKNLAQMCSDLGITTVSEKIEDIEQANKMSELGVKLGQGYCFAKPGPKPEYFLSEDDTSK